ncbi:MAG: leucine-rich repeat domain-containing protein, partial [Verrucomicrobiota bacterium]|nr:leucine-rich repeat domain-containing protein [Verrucomicrobiota bacterium]
MRWWGVEKTEPKPEPLTEEESAKIIEKEIRGDLGKPTGELTKADLEKMTRLFLDSNQLTEVPKGLEKLTQLTSLYLYHNKLTDAKGLEKLTQLKFLHLRNNQLTDVKGLE